MFKNLKDKLATQVNKTNQTIFSTILSTDSSSLPRDTNNRTSSIVSHDDNLENNRSRLDSASSDISQTTNANYVSPSRHFIPPSDIESEYGADESDHETNTKMQKLLGVYKNKFTQLKNAYDEVEHEKENLKNIVQQQQDTYIKRQSELRQKMKYDQHMKEQTESIYLKEIKSRDGKIEELTQQLTEQNKLIQSLHEDVRNLSDKNTKREALLVRCKETIKTHQEKQDDLVTQHDDLLKQLNEKQAVIDSMMKDRKCEDASNVTESFGSNMRDLSHDKEQLDSTRFQVQQLETDLQLARQQQIESDLHEEIKHERDEFKQQNEELMGEIEILKKNVSLENEQHSQSYEQLKTEYENLTNELRQTIQAKDHIQSILDQITDGQTISKDEHTNDQLNATLTKLQHDHKEVLSTCSQLTEKLDIQRQEIAKLTSQQENDFGNMVKQLRDENDRVQYHKEVEHQKATALLQIEFENLQKEQLSKLEDELKAAAKRTQDEKTALSSQIRECQVEIDRLQQSLDEHKNKSNQYEVELKEKTSQIVELENFKSQVDSSHKQLADEYNSLNEQMTGVPVKKSEQLTILQEELEMKNIYIQKIDKQLEEKQNEITQRNNTIENLKLTITKREQITETSQIDDRQLLEEKNNEIDTLKQNLSNQQSLYDSLVSEQQDYQSNLEKLNNEHQQMIEQLNKHQLIINEQQTEIDTYHKQLSTSKVELEQQQNSNNVLQQQQHEKFSELETKFNHILSEKAGLENELDGMRIRIQTTQSSSNEKASDNDVKFEQGEEKIQELETQCDSYRNEIETMKSEIISLLTINEENTRRLDEFDNEKFDFEQEITEKDRQLTESNEKIQELESTLKQTQENGNKLRKALQKMKDSMTNKEQTNTHDADIQLRKTIDEYEQRFREQDKEYNSKLKAMAKEMNAQIEEKEQNHHQQLNDFIQNTHKTESDAIRQWENRVFGAEERALVAEQHMSKMQEQLKEKQLDHYRIAQDLQNQIQRLMKQTPQTTEDFTQTNIEDLNHSNGELHSFVFEPTEVDYLKQIVLAYMTGTDRLTMAKVICAVLRYTDDEKSLIIEQEKLRQSRWLNSPR